MPANAEVMTGMSLQLQPLFSAAEGLRTLTVASDRRSFIDELCYQRDWLQQTLTEVGGLLIRGLGIDTSERFTEIVDAVGLQPMSYLRGTTPRSKISRDIYTSTDAPPLLPIPLHNEMSYTWPVPSMILFACGIPAARGGATPLADMAHVYEEIPSDIRAEFEARDVQYTQYVPGKPGRFVKRTWMAMFDTTDRDQVEEICSQQGIDATWLPNGAVRLRNRRPAVLHHPVSGVPVWFNQAHIFHHSFWSHIWRARRPLAAIAMRGYVAWHRSRGHEGRYPYDSSFGDGGEIPTRTIEKVRDVLERHTRRFDWQQGDVVILDNLRMAHARDPFWGKRRIMAALGNSTEFHPHLHAEEGSR
jgi:alpha-ketoglutarate-dependent taurine dioxygenase